MTSVSSFIGDILYFIKNDLTTNITDPIQSQRSGTSKFIMTSFPQRAVKYPLVTIKLTNQEATRAGMQTTAMDVVVTLEIRVWARNEKEKDVLSTNVYTRLKSMQFVANGSRENDLHNFQLLSMNELDEIGENSVKSRILTIQYSFWNLN